MVSLPAWLKPPYYAPSVEWVDRWQDWLDPQGSGADPFVLAASRRFAAMLRGGSWRVRMVANIGADSLLRFLRDNRYKNAYETPWIGYRPAAPDAERLAVDELLELDDPSDTYFGAIALESAGIHFYGEYSLVLAPGHLDEDERLLDRDSYELIFSPLGDLGHAERAEVVRTLRGTLDSDLIPMALLKCREILEDSQRLPTEGRLSATLLRGEEFIEVHKRGTFAPGDLEEVRQASVDIAANQRIVSAYENGVLPSVDELLWTARRADVEAALNAHDTPIPSRVADSATMR